MKLTDKFEFIKGNLARRNHIFLPPMDTLMATDGFADEFHIQHYGARSYGGVGTVVVESAAVEENGRIKEKDLGLWKNEHIEPLKKVVKVIKMGGSFSRYSIKSCWCKSRFDNTNSWCNKIL